LRFWVPKKGGEQFVYDKTGIATEFHKQAVLKPVLIIDRISLS
jgi:hypothetical protein